MPRSTNRQEPATPDPALVYLWALEELSPTAQRAAVALLPGLSTTADLLDAADLAAEHSQIERRLRMAPATAITALLALRDGTPASPDGVTAARHQLLVTGRDPELLPGVATTLKALLTESAPSPSVPPAPGLPPEEALILGQRILTHAEEHPLAVISDGRISMAEANGLGTLTDADPVVIRILARVLELAGLLHADTHHLHASSESRPWMEATAGRRWLSLCTAAAPDAPLATILHDWDGPSFADLIRQATATWPLGGDWLRPELERLREEWTVLGIFQIDGQVSTQGHRFLTGEPPLLDLPSLSETAYLQDDLRVVVPGVSHPRLAEFLRTIATPLSLSQAETYEITQATVIRALQTGTGPETILSKLAKISPTGVPQPLRYLVSRTAEELQRLTISADAAGTRLDCENQTLAETLLIDTGLRSLHLQRRSPTTLQSGATTTTVLQALQEAHYPARLLTPETSGPTRGARRPQPAAAPPTHPAPASAPSTLVPPDDLPRERLIEWALRHHVPVMATVVFPGGREATFTLMPRSLTRNRLRAADLGTDVERTLPLSAITSLHIEGAPWDR